MNDAKVSYEEIMEMQRMPKMIGDARSEGFSEKADEMQAKYEQFLKEHDLTYDTLMDYTGIRALDILNNLMANIGLAYNTKDWEMLRQGYITAAEERKDWGLPPFIGGPQIEY